MFVAELPVSLDRRRLLRGLGYGGNEKQISTIKNAHFSSSSPSVIYVFMSLMLRCFLLLKLIQAASREVPSDASTSNDFKSNVVFIIFISIGVFAAALALGGGIKAHLD